MDTRKKLTVAAVVSAFAASLVAALALWPAPVAVPPPPTPAVQGGSAPPYGMGWVNDPAAVKAVVDTLEIQDFRDTPAFKAVQGEADHAYLWEPAVKVLGKHVPTRNQGQVGSCVSFGFACGAEYLQVSQIATGRAEKFRAIAQEVIYGGSRVQIGGGRISGDGSVGAWAADWCSKYGVVPRDKYPGYDLTAYSETTCRAFGSRGCPKDLEPVAKEHPVKTVAPIRSAAEARKALDNFYPIPVCSGQGFAMQRDADGVARAQGSWPHCMTIIGYRTVPRTLFYFMNSWGETWASGPYGPGDPPPGGFWAESAVVERMLKENDSFALSDLNGFPVRRLDWVGLPVPIRAAPLRRAFAPEFALAY